MIAKYWILFCKKTELVTVVVVVLTGQMDIGKYAIV